jgi:hypothetical protein
MGDSTADDDDPDEAGDEALAVAGVGTAAAWLSAQASSIAARWARTKHRVLSAHSRYEHYPPEPSQMAAGGVAIGAWLLFMATVIVPELSRGVLAGDPSSVGMLAVSVLAVAGYAVTDLPTVDDVHV